MAFETIEVPRGQYVGWGNREGQFVEGIIIDYDPVGATELNSGKECPLIVIELSKKAASFNKDGDRTDYEPGDMVQLSVSQANLKKAMRMAAPKVGNIIRIELTSRERTPNGTVKIFTVQIDRSTAGNGGSPSRQAQQEDPWSNAPSSIAPPDDGDEPPF